MSIRVSTRFNGFLRISHRVSNRWRGLPDYFLEPHYRAPHYRAPTTVCCLLVH